MDSPIPPDPYATLGVPKDADAITIKKAYHKLALQLHPDKCVDESQKAARTDEFTKIQQAYDILGDDESRGRYNAQVRLAELRRQNMEMRSGAGMRPDVKYNVRTQAPREAAYSTRAPPTSRAAYDQPRPRYYEDDYEPSRGSTRKASVADEYVYVKRPSPREEKREKVRIPTESRDEDRRRDAKRREAEVRDARSSKYTDFEEDRRKREYENMRRRTEAEAAYERNSSSSERIYKEQHKEQYKEQMEEARRHMDRHQRPPMARRESSRQVPRYAEPAEVRRSAAPPKEKERARETRRTSPSKDERRRMAENIEPYDRRVPSMPTHTSSPPVMENMVPPPTQRSYTIPIDPEARKTKSRNVSPPPFSRTTSQPLNNMPGASSSRRKDSKAQDASYASPIATPGYPAAYSYDDERAAPHISYTNGHRTVLREPTSSRRKSPSPARPSKVAAKMKDLDPKSIRRTQYSYPSEAPAQPVVVEPSPKSSRRERERDYPEQRSSRQPRYFGEEGVGTTVDPRYEQQPQFRYAEPTARHDRFEKPTMARSSTYVY